jgi:hypothetical protein
VSDNDDDNIEFDFFEEPVAEPEPRRGLPRRTRRPDDPARPPGPSGPGPIRLARLLGLIAFAIALVLLVAKLGGCSSTSSAYKQYIEKVGPLASASEAEGKDLTGILAQPSLTEKSLEETLGGLVTKADSLIQQAQAVDPPGPLRNQHEDLVDALKLRRAALAGLLATFKRTASEKKNAAIGGVLAEQTERLAASDVLWRDLFQSATADALNRKGVHGVSPPTSVILVKPATLDATSLGNLWKRVHGTAVASNVLRGTALVGVTVSSDAAGQSPIVLSRDGTTNVRASAAMVFHVTVKDTGEVQEAHVKVTLTIIQTPALEPLTGVIPLLNPGDTQTVNLPLKGAAPVLNQPLKVSVVVAAVPHEARLDNNSHQYTVVFQV